MARGGGNGSPVALASPRLCLSFSVPRVCVSVGEGCQECVCVDVWMCGCVGCEQQGWERDRARHSKQLSDGKQGLAWSSRTRMRHGGSRRDLQFAQL